MIQLFPLLYLSWLNRIRNASADFQRIAHEQRDKLLLAILNLRDAQLCDTHLFRQLRLGQSTSLSHGNKILKQTVRSAVEVISKLFVATRISLLIPSLRSPIAYLLPYINSQL